MSKDVHPPKKWCSCSDYDPPKIHDPIVPLYPVYPHLQQWLIASPSTPYWWIPTTATGQSLQVLRQLCSVHLPADPAGDQTSQATSEAAVGACWKLTPGGSISNTNMYILSLYIHIYIYIYMCVCVCGGRDRERERETTKWIETKFLLEYHVE